MAQAASKLLRNLDIHDPQFAHDMRLWSLQVRSEIFELVVAAEATLAASKAVIAEAERILDWKL